MKLVCKGTQQIVVNITLSTLNCLPFLYIMLNTYSKRGVLVYATYSRIILYFESLRAYR